MTEEDGKLLLKSALNNRLLKLHLPKMRRPLLLHMRLLQPMEVSKMRNPTNIFNPALGRHEREGIVRIRRKIKERHYLNGKSICKRERLELIIPAKFKDIVEPSCT